MIESIRAEPAGLIRVACHPGLIAYRMGAAIAEFMAANPRVDIQLRAISRPVDVIREGFDVVIRKGQPEIGPTGLVIRKLGEVSQCVVASPQLAEGRNRPETPSDLADWPAIARGVNLANGEAEQAEWLLTHPNGSTARVRPRARLITDDLAALRAAALAGIGVGRCQT